MLEAYCKDTQDNKALGTGLPEVIKSSSRTGTRHGSFRDWILWSPIGSRSVGSPTLMTPLFSPLRLLLLPYTLDLLLCIFFLTVSADCELASFMVPCSCLLSHRLECHLPTFPVLGIFRSQIPIKNPIWAHGVLKLG